MCPEISLKKLAFTDPRIKQANPILRRSEGKKKRALLPSFVRRTVTDRQTDQVEGKETRVNKQTDTDTQSPRVCCMPHQRTDRLTDLQTHTQST